MTTALIDANSFRSEIVNEIAARMAGTIAQAIHNGLEGMSVHVAAPQVSVAAPSVSVAAPSVQVDGTEVTTEDLAIEMREIRKLLVVLVDTLRRPVTRTLTYSDGGTATLTEKR